MYYCDRFAKHVARCFAKFIKHLADNKEDRQFLGDNGKGDPSIKYLTLVELGLRNFTQYPFAMGGCALKTRESWAAVQPWRKREAYISLVCHERGHNSYRQWDNFSWEDFLERAQLARTFNTRHLPLSDGTDDDFFEEHLPDPREWNEPPPKRSKTVTKKTVAVQKPTDDDPNFNIENHDSIK